MKSTLSVIVGISYVLALLFGMKLQSAAAAPPGPSFEVVITEYDAINGPHGITAGPDGNLWFTGTDTVNQMTTNGVLTTYQMPANSVPARISLGVDGNIWFTETGAHKIGRVTPLGEVSHFTIPTPSSYPATIATGPDGRMWFTEALGDRIATMTTAGNIVEFPVPYSTTRPQPYGIVSGPDGNLWFTEKFGNRIGRITPQGAITHFSIPTTNSQPHEISVGPDGALWFAEREGNKIGRITTDGIITEYPIPTPNSKPWSIQTGPDGALWFTEFGSHKIGRITTDGEITEYPVPTAGSSPMYITLGPDNNLWFTENNGGQIGKIEIKSQADPVYILDVPAMFTPAPLPLAINPETIPIRPITSQGEVYYTITLTLPQPLPTGGHFYFSSSPDEVQPIQIDDQLVVKINDEIVFMRELFEPTIVEIPESDIQQWIGQPLTIEFRDFYGDVIGSSPVWLIWTP